MKLVKILTLAFAVSAALAFAGCSSTDSQARFEQEKKELNDFLVGSKAVETIEKNNDRTIDSLAENSSIIYKHTGGAMREYIAQSRGSQAVIEMTYFMHTTPKATEAELKTKADAFIQESCTEIEKQEMTADKLIAQAKQQYQYDAYLTFKQDFKDAEAQKQQLAVMEKDAATDPAVKKNLDDINAGRKIFKDRWATRMLI